MDVAPPAACADIVERLEAIASGDETISDLVVRHLDGCAACRVTLAAAESIERALRAIPAVEAPAGFPDRVAARLRNERWHAEERFDRVFNLTLVAALALLAAGTAALLNLSGLGGLLVDAARLTTGGVTLPAHGSQRLAMTSVLLVLTAVSGWWWATRRPGY